MKTKFEPFSEKEKELWKSSSRAWSKEDDKEIFSDIRDEWDEDARKAWYKDYEEFLNGEGIEKLQEALSEDNDGLTASWYELPKGATELKHLIWYKNMNAQVGEIFRACYRMNDCPHSDVIRNLNKIIAYAEQEKERIKKYGY